MSDTPVLVPARMLNEFTYCQRLFFIEWVQSRFADNDDTAEGSYQHRAAEKESGQAPLPKEGDLIEARSLLLSSPGLGLVARVDIVEGEGGEVRPIDIKKGRPPDTPEQTWEPERVQLCVQGLLLSEAGYKCNEGVIYFAAARRRVTVVFDEQLRARTAQLLKELKVVAERDLPPPPLIDSPKCPRCSLVGICLPDETNMLASRSDRPPRRLLPRDPSKSPLYIIEQGASLGFKANRFEVRKDKEILDSVRAIDVSQVCVYGNVQITTQALRELFSREAPILWFSHGGWFYGMAEGLPSKHVELRRRQVASSGLGGLTVAQRIVEAKIKNSRTLLRRNLREPRPEILASLADLASQTRDVVSSASLLGIEGAAARLYFDAFPDMLKPDVSLPGAVFSFDGRNRRPPLDPVNCLLSYAYALLTKELTTTSYGIGFDPYLGLYHRPRFGRPALALDLAEEFRPLIADSLVLTVINNGEVKGSDFVVRAGGVSLTPTGKRAVLNAYERRLASVVRHPTFGYTISYRRVLEVQGRILAAHLLGEVREYVPFVTR